LPGEASAPPLADPPLASIGWSSWRWGFSRKSEPRFRAEERGRRLSLLLPDRTDRPNHLRPDPSAAEAEGKVIMSEVGHVLIGEIPSRVEVGPDPTRNPLYASVRSLETIGKEVTPDPTTTRYTRGTIWLSGTRVGNTLLLLLCLSRPLIKPSRGQAVVRDTAELLTSTNWRTPGPAPRSESRCASRRRRSPSPSEILELAAAGARLMSRQIPFQLTWPAPPSARR
jgi:hypothetical protein